MSDLVTTLVLGGARSGKSAFAEGEARASGLEGVYVATAQAFDEEMAARIARHRADRADTGWRTIEDPFDLAGILRAESRTGRVLLVDCLTLWLTNHLLAGHDPEACQRDLLEAIAAGRGPLLLVSNEVGLGLVPETALGRAFRDAQGRLNQAVARVVPRVIFVAAGLPITLKPQPVTQSVP